MTHTAYLFVGLSAVVVMLLGVIVFAMLRFSAAARAATRRPAEEATHVAVLSAALQDAVTKLKAQEQAMSVRAEASEQLSSQIANSLTAGFLLVDRDRHVELLNPAARRMLALDGDPIGGDYRALLADVPPLVAVIDECMTTQTPIVRRTLTLEAPARPTHLGVTVSPLATGGEPRGVICLFSDLTKIVELEEQLRLKDALAQLGELTAGIAHEFRNGLATIHGYSRLIDPEMVPPKYKPYIDGLRQETEALGKVVTNFLNFSKPEQVIFGPVDVGALVRKVADDLRHELPQETSLSIGGAFTNIQGDEVLLRQVVANLIRNSAEACGRAGVTPAIVVTGALDPARRVCRVAVDDNGPGIPEAVRGKVFQPFFTTRSNGTGLGLAIVQKIVVMHNGRVRIGSSPGGGASLQITLPIPVDNPQ